MDPTGAAGSALTTPDAVAPPPGHRRFPLFDGLRAIAVLCIVAFHTPGALDAGWEPFERVLAHLNIGVTAFFLISGFLIYRPFVAHRVGGPAAPDTETFFKRRLLRIVPAYWVCLTILLIVPDAISLSGPNLLAQYGLVQTMPFVGDGNCTQQLVYCSLSQTWSLAVEVTFYAALPLYVIAADRLARGRAMRSWVRLELALLAVLSIACLTYGYFHTEFDVTSLATGTVLGYFNWFALGMGLAILSVATEGRRTRATDWIAGHPAVMWLGAAAIFAALVAWLPESPFLFDRTDELITNVGFGFASLLLILPAVFDSGGGAPRKVLANPAVAWVGLVSYGIFLWHLAVMIRLAQDFEGLPLLPTFLLGLGISTAIAAASYYVIERPILRYKTRPLTWLRTRPA